MRFHSAVKVSNARRELARLADRALVDVPDACKGLILEDANPIFGNAVRRGLAGVKRKQALDDAEHLDRFTQSP